MRLELHGEASSSKKESYTSVAVGRPGKDMKLVVGRGVTGTNEFKANSPNRAPCVSVTWLDL